MTTVPKNHVPPLKDAPRGEYCFPRWLDKLLVKEYGYFHNDNKPDNIFEHQRHIGSIAFADPYGATDKDFAHLVEFCTKYDLRFAVNGYSSHYPGMTLRVVIWRPKDDEKAREVCAHAFV